MNENPALNHVSTDRIQAMIDRRVLEAQTLIEERAKGVAEALVLKAKETERRLELLNGEHATLAQMKNDFVLRVVYDKDMDRLRLAGDASVKEAQEARQKQDETTQANRRNTMIAWGGFVTALIGWAITILLRYLPPATQ